MQAFRLAKRISGTSYSCLPRGAALIDSLGSREFPLRLFKMAHEMTRTEYLSAFSFRRGQAPNILVAENVGRYTASRILAQRYAGKYWRHDLANRVAITDTSGREGCWVVRTNAHEISNLRYRSDCYIANNLEDRISVSRTSDDRTIRLNFYRAKGNAFSEDDAGHIFGWAEVLIALLRQHEDKRFAEERCSDRNLSIRLSRLPDALSEREVDVCVGILQGITSEGIALRLRLSVNTVLTYRKRAYARLGISSQNELMRRVMT
jgi:DNA-binding CsgD family transcriptional regulator